MQAHGVDTVRKHTKKMLTESIHEMVLTIDR